MLDGDFFQAAAIAAFLIALAHVVAALAFSAEIRAAFLKHGFVALVRLACIRAFLLIRACVCSPRASLRPCPRTLLRCT